MPDFVTLDSGAREHFATGAVRDVQAGKGRFDLIPYCPLLRLAQLYERGAAKYGDDNWRKGMPLSVVLNSAARHLHKLIDGQVDEDHAAAVVFNVFAFIQYQEDIRNGLLPGELDDRRVGGQACEPGPFLPGPVPQVTPGNPPSEH